MKFWKHADRQSAKQQVANLRYHQAVAKSLSA
jgi:hypothetical protein